MDASEARFNRLTRVSWIGIAVNVLLTLFKFLTGVIGRSQAMIADAVESLSDVVATVVVLVSLRVSRKPVDQDHPYGHGRAETIAMGLVAVLIAAAGISIVIRMVMSIVNRELGVPEPIALIGALVTIVVKEGLYRYAKRTAQRLNSPVLAASAADHRKDALTSVATLVGIAGARAGLPILDPLAAGVVALFIFKLAYSIGLSATAELMDRLPDAALMRGIEMTAEACVGVEHAHARARYIGPSLIVDVKIDIDPDLTVAQGHQIAKAVKNELIGKVESISDVMVHVNPHYD